MTYILDLQPQIERNDAGHPNVTNFGFKTLKSRLRVVSAIVVIRSKTQHSHLMESLKSLIKQSYLREIIVVNAQSAHHLKTLYQECEQMRIRCHIINPGPRVTLAKSYNLGVRYATGRYLLLIEPHIVLGEQAIAQMLATGIPKPSPWLVGLSNPKATSYWMNKTFKANLVNLPEVSMAGGGFYVPYITSPCLLLPLDAYIGVKGMDKSCLDESLYADLCMRLHLIGGSVYQASSVNHQINPKNLSSFARFKEELNFARAWYLFHQKYFSHGTYFKKIFKRPLLWSLRQWNKLKRALPMKQESGI